MTTLVSNEGALITEDSLAQVVKSLGRSDAVQAALVTRPLLPIAVVERMMGVVADHLKSALEKQKQMLPDMLTDFVLQSWERATISLSSGYDEEQLEHLVRHFHEDKRLDLAVIIRALCLGDIRFLKRQ